MKKIPLFLKQAGELLKKQKPLVKAYDSDNFAEELRRGTVVLAQGYNGQLAKLVAEDPKNSATSSQGRRNRMDRQRLHSQQGGQRG